jgi:DNA methyltransferase 1-associated protein 1
MASKLAGGEVVLDHGTFKANQPPLAPKRKLKIDRKKSNVEWQWAPFTNQAREDGLVLHHWQKKGVEFAEYPYARFNTKLERVTYTDDEYERLLADRHWTRSDTDYLINLCHRLDLRWPVILDRYAPVPPRPLEQLQRRYYHCAHALARDRYRRSRGGRLESEGGVPAYVDQSQALGISSRTRDFDVAYEEKRRRQAHVAYCRTRAEEAEERRLRDELKAVELESRRLKRRARGQPADEPPRRSGLEAARLAANAIAPPKRPQPGQPYLQSSRLKPPEGAQGLSKGMLTKLALVLEELGVPARPIPTKLSCDAYDALRRDIVTLLSLQKLATSKDLELRQMRRAADDQHARAQHAARAAQQHTRAQAYAAPKRTAPQVTRGQVQKRARR